MFHCSEFDCDNQLIVEKMLHLVRLIASERGDGYLPFTVFDYNMSTLDILGCLSRQSQIIQHHIWLC